MNKNMIHVITLPALLASGVSLHVLSYAMEEPPEILASSPVPVTSSAITDNNPVTPDKVKSGTPNKEPVKGEPMDNKVAANNPSKSGNTKPEEVKQPNAKAETRTPVVTEEPVRQASEPIMPTNLLTLLPSKTNRDIIREAKLIGGRMDPFLSILPPPVPEVPVIPQEDMVASMPQFPDNNEVIFDKPKNTPPKTTKPGNNKAPAPPPLLVPKFEDDTSSKPAKPGNIQTQPVKPVDPEITWNTVNLGDGVELTGIITGTKPLALIKVDGESKVVAIGEFVRKDKKIKLVSIDFENQAITVANTNKKARIEIKE